MKLEELLKVVSSDERIFVWAKSTLLLIDEYDKNNPVPDDKKCLIICQNGIKNGLKGIHVTVNA